ncbi:coiled-coil domain-containing protein 81-like isoform X2 [Antedon mediterranea]|uniref:coiled-coil domain-containing protein 81-like isoform X2 n=1 Tax=Antedon mediterranea TaxID=105859 RepID=UPI003AF8C0DE
MAEVMQELVSDVKRNKLSAIPKLTDEDVVSVWENVSNFIEHHMSMQKGVQIHGLGTFTFSQKKLDIGNNKFILIQRPVFVLAEKFAQTHGLHYTKHYTLGQIPIVQLNFSALSMESPFDRDTNEACVKEVLLALSRSVQSRRNVEFTFTGIGKLSIRDGKVKMKFYKDFINMMDGSGHLAECLRNRPDTTDSVMSRGTTFRPHTSNTLVLPRITQGTDNSFAPQDEGKTSQKPGMDAIREDEGKTSQKPGMDAIREDEEIEQQEFQDDDNEIGNTEQDVEKKFIGRTSSRQVAPTAMATGISLAAEDLTPVSPPRGIKGSQVTPSPPTSKPASPRGDLPPPRSPKGRQTTFADCMNEVREISPVYCSHDNAGQELCYLCHQRAVRNIPVNFDAERRRKEQEQDRLLQQYQHMKDTEDIIVEQAKNMSDRHHSQKVAAFNLGVSEAIKHKKKERSNEFHRSYLFQRRAITPPSHIRQEEYSKFLSGQVEAKTADKMRRKHDKEFLERLEQVQLAEELASQREQYLMDKVNQTNMYQRALSAQIHIRDKLSHCHGNKLKRDNDYDEADGAEFVTRTRNLLGPLSLPVPKIILPFCKTEPLRLEMPDKKTVRFKPLPLPAAVPDSKAPIFGKNDATNEKLAEQRRRAIEVFRDQLAAVEASRQSKVLKHIKQQKEESQILDRTRRELVSDRAARHEKSYEMRKTLENSWQKAAHCKHKQEEKDKLRVQSPGILLHEQCEDYHRCGQCMRQLANCGESNIWSESRYIPGSRLMV